MCIFRRRGEAPGKMLGISAEWRGRRRFGSNVKRVVKKSGYRRNEIFPSQKLKTKKKEARRMENFCNVWHAGSSDSL